MLLDIVRETPIPESSPILFLGKQHTCCLWFGKLNPFSKSRGSYICGFSVRGYLARLVCGTYWGRKPGLVARKSRPEIPTIGWRGHQTRQKGPRERRAARTSQRSYWVLIAKPGPRPRVTSDSTRAALNVSAKESFLARGRLLLRPVAAEDVPQNGRKWDVLIVIDNSCYILISVKVPLETRVASSRPDRRQDKPGAPRTAWSS